MLMVSDFSHLQQPKRPLVETKQEFWKNRDSNSLGTSGEET
jgi:hypothetical protein